MPTLDALRAAVDSLEQKANEHLNLDKNHAQQSAADLQDRDTTIATLRKIIADGGTIDLALLDSLTARVAAVASKLS